MLSFTTVAGTGNCGTLQNASGSVLLNLACGGLYTGGGGNTVPLPFSVPDQGRTFVTRTPCDPVTGETTLGLVADPGGMSITGVSHRTCSAVGCLFGAPLVIRNPNSTPTSLCVINTVAQPAAGTASCTTGAADINLPLTSELFLTGDAEAGNPGLQPCPTCLGGTCTSGANAGMACTPGTTSLGNAGPTSHDCLPNPLLSIGSLPIAFALTSGTRTLTAVNQPTMLRVLCGYCRDLAADGSQGVQGFGKCLGGANAGQVCAATDLGHCPGSTCGNPTPCTSDADCAGDGPPPETREVCQQKDGGPSRRGPATRSSRPGPPAGNLTDGLPHLGNLASIFCIPPTFNSTVDAAGSLPGPGAVVLQGEVRLQ